MKKLFISLLLGAVGMSANAVPFLQLDIAGAHHYDNATQTIIADSNPFTLRALIDANTVADLGRTYYISAAITPNNGPGFGSFVFNGTTYSTANANMDYGIPPVDALIKDIGGHGVFPTFYAEIAFTINPLQTIAAYNTQTDLPQVGNTLYYVDFVANVSGLAAANSVHFDLYTYDFEGKLKVDAFAPFSHDAESGTHGIIIGTPMPDGGTTVLLFGAALTGLGLLRRKFAV